MKLRGKMRFVVAFIVSAFVFYIAVITNFTPTIISYKSPVDVDVTRFPHPLTVIIATLIVQAVWYGMYRWYRRDPVKHALSTLNEAERRALLHELTRETPLRLHTDDGELLDLQAEDAPPRKRKREMAE